MPATTTYGLDLEVCLGVGRVADRAVWDESRWDRAVWGASDTALGDWVDVTCDVADPFTLTAGASDAEGVVTRWEAASAAFTLYGSRWDPWDGPHAGQLGPSTPVRVRWKPTGAGEAFWQPGFLGAVTADGWHYDPLPATATTTFAATDRTAELVAFDPKAQPPVGAGETAAARVHRILDLAGWPADDRDVTGGGIPVKESTLGQPAWTLLLQLADTDLALLWVDRAGRLAYRPQGRVGVGTRLAGRAVVCPTEPDDVQLVTMTSGQQASIRNQVSISRQRNDGEDEPATVTRRDQRSITRFHTRPYTRTDLTHLDEEWSTVVADAVLAAGAWPSPAPRQITLDSALGDRRVPPLLLGLEPDYTFDVLNAARRSWRMGCVGWDVTIGRTRIHGKIVLDDLTRWVPGVWDDAGWDVDRWGVDYTQTVERLTLARQGAP